MTGVLIIYETGAWSPFPKSKTLDKRLKIGEDYGYFIPDHSIREKYNELQKLLDFFHLKGLSVMALERDHRILPWKSAKGNVHPSAYRCLLNSKELEAYTSLVRQVLDYMYNLHWKHEVRHHDFYQKILGAPGKNFFEWASQAILQGFEPYALSNEHLKQLEKQVMEFQRFIRSCDIQIHVLCQARNHYRDYKLKQLLHKGHMILGHDDPIDKVEFSLLPFIIRREDIIENAIPDLNYRKAIHDFAQNSELGGRLIHMIPPFVSIPAWSPLSINEMVNIHDFFGQLSDWRVEKVIIKGAHTAASGANSTPYRVINLQNPPEEWFLHYKEYQQEYLEYVSNPLKTSIMM